MTDPHAFDDAHVPPVSENRPIELLRYMASHVRARTVLEMTTVLRERREIVTNDLNWLESRGFVASRPNSHGDHKWRLTRGGRSLAKSIT